MVLPRPDLPAASLVPSRSKGALMPARGSQPVSLQHPSFFRENGIYVELARRVIPAEWMEEGRWDERPSEDPYSRPQEALPCPPESEK